MNRDKSTERYIEKFIERKILEYRPFLNVFKNGYEPFQYYIYFTNYTAQDVSKDKSYTDKYIEFMKSKFGARYIIRSKKNNYNLEEEQQK